MINTVLFDNQIKIWWDYNKLEKGFIYEIIFNDVKYSTCQTHFCFKNLTPDTAYVISVKLVEKNGNLIKDLGEIASKTLKKKNYIDVTKPPYNAIGDGKTINTLILQKAIDDCGENDLVYFPKGIYLTGALDLHSNLEIRLDDDAVIQGTTNEKDYLPKITSRFEGWHETCYRSLFNSGKLDSKAEFNCENIVICGGKILGGGDELRINQINTEKMAVLREFGYENDINPPALYSSFLPGRRRGRLFQFSNTKNIVVADCYFGNSPSWNFHPIYCDNVITCNCTIFSHGISNGDGWNPDSSTNCSLFGVHFDTGDDFVAIKSGRNNEGYQIGRPSKNIKVFDCTSTDGHGVAIGSEMSGGVENVYIWNCNFIKAGTGISLKTNRCRGGYMKNINFYNIICGKISLEVYSGNNDGDPAPYPPNLDGFHFEDITVCGINKTTSGNRLVAGEGVNFYCSDNYFIKNVSLKNIYYINRAVIPYQDFVAKNVENLTFENIFVCGEDNGINPY